PIGFQIWVDLGVDQENAGCPLIDPGSYRIQIGNGSYCRRPCTVATCNGREIRFWKLHDIDRIALTPEEMHFGSILVVVIDEDAHSQSKANCGFKVCDRHHKAAIASTQHRQLA